MFGRARYDYLVEMCDQIGVITPEHPFPVWTEGADRPPSCRCSCSTTTRSLTAGATTKAEGLAIAKQSNVTGKRLQR